MNYTNLLQKLELKSSNNHVAFQSVSFYYTWKNIRQQYQNNKLKIIAPTWNGEFELHDGSNSVLDIQDYIKCIKKGNAKHYPVIRPFVFSSTGLIKD